MSPETAALLADLRGHLKATETLYIGLPKTLRAAHLEGRAKELVARIDALAERGE